MGYTKYDRRKKHVRELDEQAARILAAKQQAQQGAGAQTDSEGAPAVPSWCCTVIVSFGCTCSCGFFAVPLPA